MNAPEVDQGGRGEGRRFASDAPSRPVQTDPQFRRKFTVTVMITGTGVPLSSVGV